MPHLDRPLPDDQFVVRTVTTIWKAANGADVFLEAYYQGNRNFRGKARAAIRKARRKGLTVSLGDLGRFQTEEQLKAALVERLRKCVLIDATMLLLRVERLLDLANENLRLASAKPRVAIPIQK